MLERYTKFFRSSAMATQKTKKQSLPDSGAWEPMMLVVALAGAMCLGYSFYGDRIVAPDQVAAHTTSRQFVAGAPVAQAAALPSGRN